MIQKNRPWWDLLSRCRAKRKDGQYCNNFARKAYEIEKGNLFVPLTCWIHKGQENLLRKKINDG